MNPVPNPFAIAQAQLDEAEVTIDTMRAMAVERVAKVVKIRGWA
ncbi:MAG: hypothetical protein Kow0077_08640 [Anaerolineae bacterium]